MNVVMRTMCAMSFGFSFIASAHAAMRPFVADNIKLFCDPLCYAGFDALVVECVNDHHWHAYFLLSELSSDVVVSLLKVAAQENRPDVVERILKEFKFDFDLETIDYLLAWTDGYEWPGRLVRALEAKDLLLVGSNQVPVDTRSDPE
jgi:hypothetical protein